MTITLDRLSSLAQEWPQILTLTQEGPVTTLYWRGVPGVTLKLVGEHSVDLWFGGYSLQWEPGARALLRELARISDNYSPCPFLLGALDLTERHVGLELSGRNSNRDGFVRLAGIFGAVNEFEFVFTNRKHVGHRPPYHISYTDGSKKDAYEECYRFYYDLRAP